MGMMKEFKEFAVRGNVIDMAVGIIIGAAFGKIVTSLVNDLLMPVIGKLLGNVDFAQFFVVLGDGEFKTIEAAKGAGVPTINYGLFINIVIDFIFVAFAVFMLVKGINALKRRQAEAPAAPPAPSAQEVLLTEIRDLLKHK